MGCLSRERHGCHCRWRQHRRVRRPNEEVGMCTKAAPCLSSKSSKAWQVFSNRFLLSKNQDRTGSWTWTCGDSTGQARPWQWHVGLSQQHFHQLSQLWDFSPCLLQLRFSIILWLFPLFCLPFLTVYSYSIISLFFFFQFFPFLYISPTCIPVSVLS